MVLVEYGACRPGEFSYKSGSTPTAGYLAMLTDNKELDVYDGTSRVVGIFLQSAGEEHNQDRVIDVLLHWGVIKTDVFTGNISNYTPGTLVRADSATGKITYTGGGPVVGIVVAADTTYVTYMFSWDLGNAFDPGTHITNWTALTSIDGTDSVDKAVVKTALNDLGAKINSILSALVAAGIIAAS